MIKSNRTKRVFALVLIMALVMSSVFASGDDFGFNSYMTKIKNWFYAIVGGLLVLSLIVWGGKCAIQRNIGPNDWKALAVICVAAIVIIIGPSLISGFFGDGNLGGLDI